MNAPENVELDSEGESFSFTVESAGEWTVSSSADWLSISKDGNTVSISAPVNAEDHRTAALTVTATAGNDTQAATINVEQQSRNENTYYNMLGYYGLRANDWYINTAAVGEAGIGAFCTIEEKEYRKSFIIKDLFANGTEVSATYDSRSKKMSIDLGALCVIAASGEEDGQQVVHPGRPLHRGEYLHRAGVVVQEAIRHGRVVVPVRAQQGERRPVVPVPPLYRQALP